MSEIWPHLLTAMIAAVGTYVGAIHKLKVEVEVLKKTQEDERKDIDNIQKRLDSHSKKNDEIIKLINDLKVEVIQQIAKLATEMSKISSDVENINRVFTINDNGIMFKK